MATEWWANDPVAAAPAAATGNEWWANDPVLDSGVDERLETGDALGEMSMAATGRPDEGEDDFITATAKGVGSALSEHAGNVKDEVKGAYKAGGPVGLANTAIYQGTRGLAAAPTEAVEGIANLGIAGVNWASEKITGSDEYAIDDVEIRTIPEMILGLNPFADRADLERRFGAPDSAIGKTAQFIGELGVGVPPAAKAVRPLVKGATSTSKGIKDTPEIDLIPFPGTKEDTLGRVMDKGKGVVEAGKAPGLLNEVGSTLAAPVKAAGTAAARFGRYRPFSPAKKLDKQTYKTLTDAGSTRDDVVEQLTKYTKTEIKDADDLQIVFLAADDAASTALASAKALPRPVRAPRPGSARSARARRQAPPEGSTRLHHTDRRQTNAVTNIAGQMKQRHRLNGHLADYKPKLTEKQLRQLEGTDPMTFEEYWDLVHQADAGAMPFGEKTIASGRSARATDFSNDRKLWAAVQEALKSGERYLPEQAVRELKLARATRAKALRYNQVKSFMELGAKQTNDGFVPDPRKIYDAISQLDKREIREVFGHEMERALTVLKKAERANTEAGNRARRSFVGNLLTHLKQHYILDFASIGGATWLYNEVFGD